MDIRLILFVVFLTVPLVEIYLLIQVGGIIGALPTIFLVVFTAVLGALLLRHQGLATLMRAREQMEQGVLPAMPMLEGMALLAAGLLLLTPGFLTDAIGFLLLVPPLRQALIRHLFGGGRPPGPPPGTPGGQAGSHPTHTIEGEYWREDD